MSTAGRAPNASTSSGSCRPTATAAISAPAIGGRAVDLAYLQPDRAGGRPARLSTACCCRPAGAARTPGSSPRRCAPLTERLRFLVAVRPGLQPPTVAARMAATLDRHLGRAAADQRRHRRRPGREQGRRHLPRATPSATRSRASSCDVCKRAARRRDGRRTRASTSASRAGSCSSRRCSSRYPPLYFGGSSEAGDRRRGRAGRHVPDLGRAAGRLVAEKIATVARPPAASAAASSASASACTSSCARPRKRPGRRPTG